MRLCLILSVLLVGTSPLWASEIGIQWPGWEVRTSEKAANKDYPLTNLLDNNPKTAWVFNRFDGYEPSTDVEYVKRMTTEFNHGIKKSITIRKGQDKTFICDGIGIINGYAKNSTIYQQNNRITKISLICSGGKNIWSKTYSLKETLDIQKLSIPHLRLNQIRISFDEVQAGNDDDLCISDLVLYHGKNIIPWLLTPSVICNKELGCDSSPMYMLLHGNKEVIPTIDNPNIYDVFSLPDNPNHVILFTGSNQLSLYDFKSDKYLYRQQFTGWAENFGWQTKTIAILQTYNYTNKNKTLRKHWYQLNIVDFSLKAIKAIPEKSRGFMRVVEMGC